MWWLCIADNRVKRPGSAGYALKGPDQIDCIARNNYDYFHIQIIKECLFNEMLHLVQTFLYFEKFMLTYVLFHCL